MDGEGVGVGAMLSARGTDTDLYGNYFPGWLQGWQVLHCRASGPGPIPVPPCPGLRLWVGCGFVSSEYVLLLRGPRLSDPVTSTGDLVLKDELSGGEVSSPPPLDFRFLSDVIL